MAIETYADRRDSCETDYCTVDFEPTTASTLNSMLCARSQNLQGSVPERWWLPLLGLLTGCKKPGRHPRHNLFATCNVFMASIITGAVSRGNMVVWLVTSKHRRRMPATARTPLWKSVELIRSFARVHVGGHGAVGC